DVFAKLEQLPLTMNHYKLIAAAVLGDMLEFFDYFIIGFILSFIVVPWHLSYAATAIVFLSAGVGSLLGAFFFGWLADRIGRMPVLYMTVAFFTIPSGIMYFTPEGNWHFLTAFRFLVGAGVGGLYSVDLPLVQEFTPIRVRGAVGGIVAALCPGGTLLGSIAAAFLTPIIGWRGLFLIGLIPAAISILFRLWLRESPRWLVSRGRYEEALKSINWVTGENIAFSDIDLSKDLVKEEKSPSIIELFKYPRSVAVTWISSFLMSTMDYGFVLWGPTLLVLVLKIPPTEAAKLFIAVPLAGVIGKIIWAFLSETFGRRPCGIAIGVGSIITCLAISRFYNTYWGSVALIYPTFVAVYAFIDGGWSITGPYSAEVWPQRLRASGMGSAYGIGGLGRIFGPMVLALFAGTSNLVTPKATIAAIGPAYIFFAICGLMVAITYSFGIETRNKSVAEIEKLLGVPASSGAAGTVAGRG
ncbi:MAG: MFS transporter, partial [Candidatus Korobacteraceae bacterium]